MRRVKVKRVVPGPVCRDPEKASVRNPSRAERKAEREKQLALFEGQR